MENSLFVSDSELTDMINASIRSVYRKIVKAYGDQYFGSSTNITTVAGTSEYALPADFLKLGSYGVWWVHSSTHNTRLSRFNPNESLAQLVGQGWTWYPYGTNRANVRYNLHTNKIRFLPTPQGVHTITVFYVPTPTPLVDPGDLFNGIAGYEMAVVWDAVATCLAKQESDASFAIAQRDREFQDMLETVDPDQNEPPHVQWAEDFYDE